MSSAPIQVKHDWRPYAVGMVIISVIEILVLFFVNRDIAILIVGSMILPVVLLLCILVIKFIDFITPVVLESKGVRCYTGFGMRTSVQWKDVKATRNFIIWPGLKWIFLDDGRKIINRACIPIFIQDKSRFFREVAMAAGEDHVVVKALRENGFG
jgi:hypothetical protein